MYSEKYQCPSFVVAWNVGLRRETVAPTSAETTCFWPVVDYKLRAKKTLKLRLSSKSPCKLSAVADCYRRPPIQPFSP